MDQLLVWKDVALPIQENSIIDIDMQGGGMAATAMATVCRLGGNAELWSTIGEDWAGEKILRALRAEGVDTSQIIQIVEGSSFFMVVCVDQQTGERHFMHTGRWDKPKEAIGDLSRLDKSGCLLIDHALPESELPAAKEAQRLGVPVVSDTNGFNAWHREIMPFVDYAIVSERGAMALKDDLHEACKSIQGMGAKCVVVTLGENGLVYLDGDTFGRLPAFEVKVVDTTGAGDVFHGAFCYGLVHGFSLRANLRFASATSAMKCRQIGGRGGIPNREQVDEFLQKRSANLDHCEY